MESLSRQPDTDTESVGERRECTMAINVHAHLSADDDLEERVAGYSHPDVSHTVLCGDDDAVEKAMTKYPDRIIGLGTVSRRKPATPQKIKEFVDRGFKGVKIIGMGKPYDSPDLFPLYEAIEENALPILFHTGYLATGAGLPREARAAGVAESMLFMRPGTLDTLARLFPNLAMIAAHLGQPWCEEACSVMWKHKNVYCDMSGGTVKLKSLAQLKHLFMKGAAAGHLREDGEELHVEMVEKLVFGTDNPSPPPMLEFYGNFCDKLGVDEETRYKILTGNAARIFGVEDAV